MMGTIKCYACPAPAVLILRLPGKAFDLCPSCYQVHHRGNRLAARIGAALLNRQGKKLSKGAGA
jgi:hypothetical protein